MNPKRLLILFAFAPLFTKAQTFYKNGSFVIKGQVKNFKEPVFDFGMTTYFGNTSNSVKVQPNGNFEQKFPVQKRQSIYLYLNNDAITFTVQDKDTITIYWDETDFKNTFSIKGNNEGRTKDLKGQLALYYEYRRLFMSLNDTLYKDRTLTDDKKYALINELFNHNVQAALITGDLASENFNHLLMQLYFQYSNILYTHRLIPRYKLKLTSDSTQPNPFPPFIDYTMLNENWFWNVPEYRDFIYDYIRFTRPFYSFAPFRNNPGKPFNPTLDEYYLAQANFYYPNIRDWFITKSIMFGFEHYNFTDVENVYKQAANTVASSFLKDTLLKFYTAIKRLKPGNPAPGFSLKNDQGKLVSLSDFKGKVLFIDFWGVGCGPCIYDIKKHVPQLHEHYKGRDVVFISICVDSKENEWKEALTQYKLDGVNLIAEGWGDHPVCKAYNIDGIPHYVLIDKTGKISDNNAPRASDLDLGSGKNAIDLLLK
jgi:peroxiredoxin